MLHFLTRLSPRLRELLRLHDQVVLYKEIWWALMAGIAAEAGHHDLLDTKYQAAVTSWKDIERTLKKIKGR